MSDIFEAVKSVTEIFSLLAFLSSVAFLGLSRYLKYRAQVAATFPDDEARIKYLKNWLNLNTVGLDKRRTFDLAEKVITLQHKRFVMIAVLSLAALALSLIFLAIVVIFYSPRPGLNATCEDKLRQADFQLNRSDAWAALSLYQEAGRICAPTDHRPLVGEGASYYDLAKYAEAERLFLDAYNRAKSLKTASSADLGILLVNRGYALEGQAKFSEALSVYEGALNIFPPSSRHYNDAAFSIGRMMITLWVDKDYPWPAPGSEDTELGVLMEPEVGHGETEVYAGVQA